MNLKQTTLATAVVATLALPSAYAAVVIGKPGNVANDPYKLAIEAPIESSGTIVNNASRLNIIVPAIGGYTTSPVNRLYYRITLKGGVKFDKTPYLQCIKSGGSPITANLQVPTTAIGASTVAFLLTANTTIKTAAGSAVCTVTFIGANPESYKITDKTDKSVSAVLQYKEGSDTKSASYVGNFITFVQSNAVKITASTLVGAVYPKAKIDVTEASKKFVSASAVVSTKTTAYVGTISFGRANSNYPVSAFSRTGNIVSANRVYTTGTITVSGLPVAGAKAFYLASAVGTKSACKGPKTTDGDVVPSNGTITFTKVTPKELSAGLNICMVLNGTSTVDAGQLTVTLTGKAATTGGTWQPNFGTTKAIHNLKKNGSSFRVLNIPNPTSGDKAFVRLYNPNSAPVTVRGSLIGEDGVQLGSVALLSTVPAYGVDIIDSADLVTAFGATTWTGRARLIVDAESNNFTVQATIRTPSGVLTNMSSETAQ